MDRSGFDPRYNPEFQRGFDPAVHVSPAATAETHERIQPPTERGRPAPILPAPPVLQVQPPATDAGAAVEDDVDDVDDSAASPWRNPYIIALTVIGVVLIAAGIGAFRWSVEQVYGGRAGFVSDDEEGIAEAWLAAQLAWGLSPLLALAGVLTLLGVGFFVAVRWQPRRRPEDGDYDDLLGEDAG